LHTKHLTFLCAALLLGAAGQPVRAHLIGEEAHAHGPPRYDFSVQPPTGIVLHNHDEARGAIVLTAANPGQPWPTASGATTAGASTIPGPAARVASIFSPFAPKVRTRADDKFVYVEADSMPDHIMMVGITAWQQQEDFLYDLAADLSERNNLAKQQPAVAAQKLAELKAHVRAGLDEQKFAALESGKGGQEPRPGDGNGKGKKKGDGKKKGGDGKRPPVQ
jgi:hypothetical protein